MPDKSKHPWKDVSNEELASRKKRQWLADNGPTPLLQSSEDDEEERNSHTHHFIMKLNGEHLEDPFDSLRDPYDDEDID